MRGTLRIDYVTGKIIMSREFAKAAKDTFSPEYLHLQEVKRDNPTFTIGRKTIKKNEDKDDLENKMDRLYEDFVEFEDNDVDNYDFDKLFFKIKVGNDRNSFDEALNSMEYFCKALFNILEE